jgi:hypothetical protein
MSSLFSGWSTCADCGDDYPSERSQLGYRTCLFCGEDRAKAERMSWCVIQEYTKGNYQFVTQTSAPATLRNTNQKSTRADLR